MNKSLLFLTLCCLGGCHTTTVSVVAEDPDAPPELIVDILNCPAGQVEVSNSTKTDWPFGGRHNTTTIVVPPGTKIVVMPSTQPRYQGQGRARWMPASRPTTGPATQPATQPDSRPAE